MTIYFGFISRDAEPEKKVLPLPSNHLKYVFPAICLPQSKDN